MSTPTGPDGPPMPPRPPTVTIMDDPDLLARSKSTAANSHNLAAAALSGLAAVALGRTGDYRWVAVVDADGDRSIMVRRPGGENTWREITFPEMSDTGVLFNMALEYAEARAGVDDDN